MSDSRSPDAPVRSSNRGFASSYHVLPSTAGPFLCGLHHSLWSFSASYDSHADRRGSMDGWIVAVAVAVAVTAAAAAAASGGGRHGREFQYSAAARRRPPSDATWKATLQRWQLECLVCQPALEVERVGCDAARRRHEDRCQTALLLSRREKGAGSADMCQAEVGQVGGGGGEKQTRGDQPVGRCSAVLGEGCSVGARWRWSAGEGGGVTTRAPERCG